MNKPPDVTITLSDEEGAQLEELARLTGCTPSEILVAAVKYLEDNDAETASQD